MKNCICELNLPCGSTLNNAIIESSIMPYIDFYGNDNNVIIRNNIFPSWNTILRNISNGSIIENNILYLYGNSWGYCFDEVYNSIIKNNVLYRPYNNSSNGILSGTGNSFENNLIDCPYSYNTTANSFLINYFEPFANVFPNGIGNPNSYYSDLHISNPTQYLGTDGTQIGIYGGSHPYKENAIPSNPRIVSKIIAPENDVNGNLPVNIKVKAQNN